MNNAFFHHRHIAKEAGCTYYVSEERCKKHGHRFKWTLSGYFMCCHPNTIPAVEHTRKYLPVMNNVVSDLR